MGRTRPGPELGDAPLLAAVREGSDVAWETFLRRWSPLLFSIVSRLHGGEDARRAFVDLAQRLHAGNCAALGDWKAGISMTSYLSFKTADLMSAQLTFLLGSDVRDGWTAFESLYGGEIGRIARERVRLAGLADDDALDLEQDIKVRLMDDRGGLLRRFRGNGSFTGYVRIVVRNLAEDLMRERLGRRREPEAVQRLDATARRIHRLLHVEGLRADQLGQVVRDEAGNLLPQDEIAAALTRLDRTLGGRPPSRGRPRIVSLTTVSADGEERERRLPVEAPSPEDIALAEEARGRQEAALEALSSALARLPDEARTYLRHRFLAEPVLPPRQIADRMGLPVEEIYRRRRQWEDLLRAELRAAGVEKFAGPSV